MSTVTEERLRKLAAERGMSVQHEQRQRGKGYWYLRKWAQTGQGRKGGRPVGKLLCSTGTLIQLTTAEFTAAADALDTKVAALVAAASNEPPAS